MTVTSRNGVVCSPQLATHDIEGTAMLETIANVYMVLQAAAVVVVLWLWLKWW